MKEALIYSMVFVVGIVVRSYLEDHSLLQQINYYLKVHVFFGDNIYPYFETIEIFFSFTQMLISFIWIYALLKKAYPSRSTFLRGIIMGILIGMISNFIFGLPLSLLWISYSFGYMLFVSIALLWLACFVTGQVLAFTYDRLMDRFLKPSVGEDGAEL